MTEGAKEDYKYNGVCRFCEKNVDSDKVGDHCHLTGKYKCPAHSKCNIIVTQDKSIFVPFFFITLVTMIVICSSRNELKRRMMR